MGFVRWRSEMDSLYIFSERLNCAKITDISHKSVFMSEQLSPLETKMKITKALQKTAYHEAGHAVIAWDLV